MRALRACEEQEKLDCTNEMEWGVSWLFTWDKTKEEYRYWYAILGKDPNPDEYLPENYVDVDHVVEPNEMVKDEFLEWLDWQIEHAEASPNLPQAYWAWSLAKEKYNELKK